MLVYDAIDLRRNIATAAHVHDFKFEMDLNLKSTFFIKCASFHLFDKNKKQFELHKKIINSIYYACEI